MIELVYSLFGISGLALLVWAVRSVKRWGAANYAEKIAKEKQQAVEKQLEEIRDVKEIEERLRRDAAYRHRVRAYFKKPKPKP